MKRVIAVLILGLIALGVQGGLAMVLPRALCPDLALLVVIAIGLHWHDATPGLFVASALGFAADLLSSSIFGAHALLRVLVFATTSLARSQMDLRGGAVFALFAGVVTVVDAAGLLFLLRVFGGSAEGFQWGDFGGVFPHALVNAILAPLVSATVVRLCDRVDGEDTRRGLEIDAKRPAT